MAIESLQAGQATMKRLTDDYITMSFEAAVSSAGTLFFIWVNSLRIRRWLIP